MAEVRGNQPQTPMEGFGENAPAAAIESDAALLAQGIEVGREWARSALQKTMAWIDENPGSALLCAAAAGFVVGKLVLRQPRVLEDEDDD
jgi:ElaB/YqjD/DUF883 family membrane-anchored ribosome-binding protein